MIQGLFCQELRSGYFETSVGLIALTIDTHGARLKFFNAPSDQKVTEFISRLSQRDAQELLKCFTTRCAEGSSFAQALLTYQTACKARRKLIGSIDYEDAIAQVKLIQFDKKVVLQSLIVTIDETDARQADAFIAAVVERSTGL